MTPSFDEFTSHNSGNTNTMTSGEPAGDSVEAVVESQRQNGRKIGQCHGVFDLLHPGHLRHLAEAKKLVDFLVVSVTSDDYVNKGPGRPVFAAEDRAAMLSALEFVDFVFLSSSPNAVEAIRKVKPDFYIKGPDYSNSADDPTGNIAKEELEVNSQGGKVIFTESATMSSSTFINSAGLGQTEHLREWLKEASSEISSTDLDVAFDNVAKLRVLVVGEAIVDRYVFCDALGKTSKEPVLAFLRTNEEHQMGGSIAIAKHVAGLGAETTLLTRLGDDRWGRKVAEFLDAAPDINPVIQISGDSTTIVKTRFVENSAGSKVFETYDMKDSLSSTEEDVAFVDTLLSIVKNYDLVVVADYGHGLLSESVIKALGLSTIALAVNTQSNAGNRGFNSIKRYGRLDIVSLNGGELQLELRDNRTTVENLLPELGNLTSAEWVIVTKGANGLSIWSRTGTVTPAPAFSGRIKDRVGAGDAVFVVAALFLHVGTDPRAVGLLANLAGASVVSELGNRVSLKAEDLKRHAIISLK